jgi:hypothetical protein
MEDKMNIAASSHSRTGEANGHEKGRKIKLNKREETQNARLDYSGGGRRRAGSAAGSVVGTSRKNISKP